MNDAQHLRFVMQNRFVRSHQRVAVSVERSVVVDSDRHQGNRFPQVLFCPTPPIDEFREGVHLGDESSVAQGICHSRTAHSEVHAAVVGVIGIQMLPRSWRRHPKQLGCRQPHSINTSKVVFRAHVSGLYNTKLSYSIMFCGSNLWAQSVEVRVFLTSNWVDMLTSFSFSSLI